MAQAARQQHFGQGGHAGSNLNRQFAANDPHYGGQTSKKEIAMVAAFTAAVTSFVTGLPLEFVTGAFTFPWAHETAFGNHVMQATSSFLVPVFNEIGTWFGIEPYGVAAEAAASFNNTPTVEF